MAVPGTIKALNKDTGVIYYIRPDMLKVDGHPWELIKDDSEKTQAIEAKVSNSTNEPTVILTSKGEPFSTENAAKSAMKRKGLSDTEWIVMDDGKGGFIITKV
jgi:hypothetical protein